MRTYILPDRVYCAHCIAEDHDNLADRNYGKMRLHWQRPMLALLWGARAPLRR